MHAFLSSAFFFQLSEPMQYPPTLYVSGILAAAGLSVFNVIKHPKLALAGSSLP